MKRFRSLLVLTFVGLLFTGCGGTRPASRTPEAQPVNTDDASVVAVYNNQVLTLDEFEDRYARSIGGRAVAAGDSLEAYQDFLERYVNFRLKVLAAEAAGLNREPGILSEIQTYRTNLARPYLLEQEILEPIIRDLYEREKTMVDASHILLRVAPDATPADTLAAYNRLAALVDSLKQGADFGTLAVRHSEDPSARGTAGSSGAAGRLGFFKAGRMVPEFEDAAYTTPVGEVSPIFRTRFGYHILKVHARQPTVPDIRIGHIMLVPREGTSEDSAATRARLDSLRARLLAGEDFAALAREHSQDLNSAARGGELGALSFDVPMPPAPQFKEAAFSIEEEGGYSEIVETQFGYHVIKLYDRVELPPYDEAYDDLKQRATRLPRARAAERRFAAKSRTLRGVEVDTAFVHEVFAGVAPDSLPRVLGQKNLPASALSHPFATLGDSTYTLDELVDFAASAGLTEEPDTRARLWTLVDRFLDEKALNYETAALEERDPEFARIMEEFREGLMLFKLMEDSVWNAAAQDSAALLAFYTPRADQYRFPDRTRIIGFYGPKDTLAFIAARLDEGLSVAELRDTAAADTLRAFRIDTTFVAGETGSIFDQALQLAEGEHTEVLSHRREHVLLLRDGEEPARRKTFAEARPDVVADYQQFLEARLLDRLRRTYRVQTFPDRLVRAFADARQREAAASAE